MREPPGVMPAGHEPQPEVDVHRVTEVGPKPADLAEEFGGEETARAADRDRRIRTAQPRRLTSRAAEAGDDPKVLGHPDEVAGSPGMPAGGERGLRRGERAGQEEVVGVEPDEVAPMSAGETLVEGVTLAAIRLAHPPRQPRGVLLQKFARPIGAAAVDDDEFEILARLGQDGIQGRPEETPVVIRGDDDAEERGGHLWRC